MNNVGRRIFLAPRLMAILCILFVSTAGIEARAQSAAAPGISPSAKNVILLIGDGMSMEVVGLMREYARVIENRQLHLEDLMNHGALALVHAVPTDKLVIDSSAAATAIAAGHQTMNGMVSVLPDGSAVPTIAELAGKSGRATGLVTTTTITHATPAAFAAHAQERNSEAEIAQQMSEASVDVLMGGGLVYWIPAGHAVSEFAKLTPPAGAESESLREDNLNLLEKMQRQGYQLVHNREALLAAPDSVKMLGLFSASHMPYALDRQPDDRANVPSLPEMTSVALRVLSRNKNGFFLMVEGGRIDHAAHNHDAAAMLAEALEFDEAVGLAFDFARTHPQTVVLVTADHATGAPVLTARYSDSAGETLYPGDEALRSIARQDASFEGLLQLLGADPSPLKLRKVVYEHTGLLLSSEESEAISRAGPLTPFYVVKPKYRAYAYPMQALARALGIEYSMSWATVEHFAQPVLLVSYGLTDPPNGYVEQTDIFKIMRQADGF